MSSVDTSALVLGQGEIRIDTSSMWQDQNTSVLNSDQSLGLSQECVINNELGYKTKRNVENISDVKKILVKNNLFLDATIYNATRENLNMLLTGNRQSFQEFYFGGDLFNNEYRIEVKFTYPNKIDFMMLILPRIKIVSTSDLNLVSLSEPNKPSFQFQSFPIENDVWGKDLGKVEFGQQ